MWHEYRLAMRSLDLLTGFNGAGSQFQEIVQECEDAQSAYLDYWVGGISTTRSSFGKGFQA